MKIRLIERGKNETITSVAKKLGYARNTVSLALNHNLFPKVRRRVLAHLGLTITPHHNP